MKPAPAPMENRPLVITRLIDAPPELVFRAWTKREHLVQWWGPKDFSVPLCKTDFRVGGAYRFCMRAPDGSDHWVWGAYREIVPPSRLVFTWERDDEPGLRRQSRMVVTVTFANQDGRTRLTLHQTGFQTAADLEGHDGGWNQCLDRLAAWSNPPAGI